MPILPLPIKYYVKVIFNFPSVILSYLQYLIDKKKDKILGSAPVSFTEFRKLWGSIITLRYIYPVIENKNALKAEMRRVSFNIIDEESDILLKRLESFTFSVIEGSLDIPEPSNDIGEFLKTQAALGILRKSAEFKYATEHLINLVVRWL